MPQPHFLNNQAREVLQSIIMLDSQRERAHLRGRLVATGLDEQEARQVSNRDIREFRPAFVQGCRRAEQDARLSLSLVRGQERRARRGVG